MNRIISKEEERRSKERFFNLSSSTVVFPHSYKIPPNTVYSTVFLHAIQQLQVILHTELILLQEILQLQGSSRADQYKASSSNCSPCLQAFYTAEYSTPSAPHTSRLPVILPGRNSILHGSQHPRSPYSNSQASSTSSTLQNSTRRNRIHSKGLSIVCPRNTKVSVFQFTYSCFRIILQEN